MNAIPHSRQAILTASYRITPVLRPPYWETPTGVAFFGLCVFFPGVFLSSRVTRACPVTTDLIMRVNVRTTTTTTNFNFYGVLGHMLLVPGSCGLEKKSENLKHQKPHVCWWVLVR